MKRPLRPEERELWNRVARSVRPLAERTILESPAGQAKPVPTKRTKSSPAELSERRQSPLPSFARSSAPAGIDQKTVKRIRKGRTAIDARFDLHGLTRDDAYDRLLSFLALSRAMGRRTVLVITGKGYSGGGVLRREVPLWLANPEFRMHVSGMEEAALHHGGEGALYIRLRRPS